MNKITIREITLGVGIVLLAVVLITNSYYNANNKEAIRNLANINIELQATNKELKAPTLLLTTLEENRTSAKMELEQIGNDIKEIENYITIVEKKIRCQRAFVLGKITENCADEETYNFYTIPQ